MVGNERDYSHSVSGANLYHVHSKLFACGDCRKGQSLVVHAINEGRQAARLVDAFLTSGISASGDATDGIPLSQMSSLLPGPGGVVHVDARRQLVDSKA